MQEKQNLCPINHQVVGFLEGSNVGRSPEQEGAASSSGVSAVPQEERFPNRCLKVVGRDGEFF